MVESVQHCATGLGCDMTRGRSRLREGRRSPLEVAVGITLLLLAIVIGAGVGGAGALGPMGLTLSTGISRWPTSLWLVIAASLAVIWAYAVWDERKVQRTAATHQGLRSLDPEQFERWCEARLQALGYGVRRVGGSADHGIDLIAERDGKKWVVQCKRYVSSVSVSEPQVRELFGAMHDQSADRALLMTAGTFTKPARAWSVGKPIDLWDLGRLAKLTGSAPVVATALARGAQPEPAAPGNELNAPPPAAATETTSVSACPRCGSPLLKRTNRGSGSEFWGCSTFPRCRHTQPTSAGAGG